MMQVMILYLAGESIYEMFFMKDPEFVTYTKPLSKEEKLDLVPLKFNDFNYVIAIRTDIWDTEVTDWKHTSLPAEVGMIIPW